MSNKKGIGKKPKERKIILGRSVVLTKDHWRCVYRCIMREGQNGLALESDSAKAHITKEIARAILR